MHATRRVITVQQGPGEVVVAMNVEFDETLAARNAVAALSRLEQTLRAWRPDMRWIPVEPDRRRCRRGRDRGALTSSRRALLSGGRS